MAYNNNNAAKSWLVGLTGSLMFVSHGADTPVYETTETETTEDKAPATGLKKSA